ncbi:MAG: response regulator transcription factor [Planctomycetes bacterium]|nr:response regulator transcription factor [Planctomycetota bacterium]
MATRAAGQSSASAAKLRVLLVDDHPIVGRAVAGLLAQEPDMAVCATAHDTRAALGAIGKLNPDVAVVDISLPGTSGLELLGELAARFPKLPVLVFSQHDEALYAERCLRAGARGYLMKDAPPEELVNALRRIAGGKVYVSEKMTSAMLSKVVKGGAPQAAGSPIERLTNREMEVFRLIGQGFTTRQAAGALALSPKTVESHCAKIKEKLGLHHVVQLQQRAALWVKGIPAEGPPPPSS